MKCAAKLEDNALTVIVDGFPHVVVRQDAILGIQSWVEGTHRHKYTIEFTLRGGSMLCIYDRRDKWELVLKALSKLPIFAEDL